jgi:glycosyltransferase involved in cell wall biosynthesis
VNPSLCEGLNMVTVEAAAVGTPTITSDGAGICAWIERLNCGDVVPAGQAGLLADAIMRALDSKALRDAWSEACRKLVPEFAPRNVAAQLLDCVGSRDR